MMKYTLTLQESHLQQIRLLINKEDQKERPAILLCGISFINNDVWDGGSETRFLSKQIIEIPDEEIISNSSTHVTWDTTVFRRAMMQAKEENLAICLVHSHPNGYHNFSEVDDINERALFETINRRNGILNANLSLIVCDDGHIAARACSPLLKFHPINLIRVFGKRFAIYYKDKYGNQIREEFSRQALAFGPSLSTDLSKLRIGIIGCGATGSATAHLLTRLGAGHLLLIDKDFVERSNLSRLYGPTTTHADLGSEKAETIAKYLANIGMGTRVRFFATWVGDEQCRDAIKSCDLIFCCTDDNAGRIFLNRFSYFYLTPVLDMGIAIDIITEPAFAIRSAQGRCTVIQPGSTCLLCREVVNSQLAREENLKRADPAGFDRQKEEAYVIGGGNPNPAVITFTTEAATMSVSELINRITGFKKHGTDDHVVRFFDQGIDRKPKCPSNPNCPICSSIEFWGRGDTDPFLEQIN